MMAMFWSRLRWMRTLRRRQCCLIIANRFTSGLRERERPRKSLPQFSGLQGNTSFELSVKCEEPEQSQAYAKRAGTGDRCSQKTSSHQAGERSRAPGDSNHQQGSNQKRLQILSEKLQKFPM